MGLDVIAISKARPVACDFSEEMCDGTHLPAGYDRRRCDGLKPGCYVAAKNGRHAHFCVSYRLYNVWRADLSYLALNVAAEEVWEHFRRYRGKPFAELIDSPDCGCVTFGPQTSAKLHADFVAFAREARKHYFDRTPPVEPPSRKPRRRAKRRLNAHAMSAEEEAPRTLKLQVSDEQGDIEWMWKVYCDFRRIFKVASNDGFATYC